MLDQPDNERGAALLISLIVTTILVVLGTHLVNTSLTDLQISESFRDGKAALYQAESGLQESIVDFAADPDWIGALFNIPCAGKPTLKQPFPGSFDINSHTVVANLDSSGNVVPGYTAFGNPLSLHDGTYAHEIMLPPTPVAAGTFAVRVRSTGRSGTHTTTVQTVRADLELARGGGRSPWDNAVFAGGGELGRPISGNSRIHGAVHMIGDAGMPTDFAFSGSGGVFNDYRNAADPNELDTYASKLPRPPLVDVGGETVMTLNASLRYEFGDVTVDGSANLGQANTLGDRYKETLDGIYINGSLNDDATGVHVDAQGPYDQPSAFFPGLSTGFYPGSGDGGGGCPGSASPTTSETTRETSTKKRKKGGSEPSSPPAYRDHRAYLDSEAMTLAITSIDADTPAFKYADADGNYIGWDPVAEELWISGIVRVDGDLSIGSGPETIAYRGTGTLYSTGTVNIAADIFPHGSYVVDALGNPGDNLGLIANTVILPDHDGRPHQRVIAAIYANDRVEIAKNVTVGGAVVSDFVDMGANNPSFYHVPVLAENLPPGMPDVRFDAAPQLSGLSNWYHERE